MPQDLRVIDPFDLRLEDDKFLQKISVWISDNFEIPKIKIGRIQKESLKVYLKFIQNPDMAKNAIKFVIKHELGHVANNHGEKKLLFYLKSIGVCVSFSVIAVIILAVVIPLSISTSIFVVFIAGIISSIATCKIGGIFISLQHEREADAFAIKEDRSAADGGIYFFEVIKNHFKSFRERKDLSLKEKVLSKIAFAPDGDSRFDFHHPHESERIRSIRQSIKGSSLYDLSRYSFTTY